MSSPPTGTPPVPSGPTDSTMLEPITVTGQTPAVTPTTPTGLPIHSLSGMLVFHHTIQILIGESVGTLKDVTYLFPPMEMISLHYDDPISFEADCLEITFADIGDQIIKSAGIKKGLWMQVIIYQFNRDYPGSIVKRDLGSFQIDQIKTQWPVSQVTLLASSVPISSQIKLTLQNRTLLVTDLKDLGAKVATENGLKFKWDAPESRNRPLNMVSQWNESDLQMLSRVLKANAMSFKIVNIDGAQTLVIFDEQDKEQQPPVYTIDFSLPGAGMGVVHGELTTQSQDIYSTSQMMYYDPNADTIYMSRADASNDTASAETLNSFTPKNDAPKGSGSYISNDQTEVALRTTLPPVPGPVGSNTNTQDYNDDDAAMLLRAKNIKEFHSVLTTAATLCFPTGTAIVSAVVVTFKNKGLFDGNWIIQKVTIHVTEGKLVVDIEFRKCMEPLKSTKVVYMDTPDGDGSDSSDSGSDGGTRSVLTRVKRYAF